MNPISNKMLCSLLLATTLSFTARGQGSIPDRPEKLTYPPFLYEPPRAADHRVQLQAGPVAFLAPDHERPLINITVYVRTGEFMDPAGKEGLADLTGYLLARGGAGTNSADGLEERTAYLAALLESGIGDIPVSGGGTINCGVVSLNLLSKDLDEGLKMLRDVIYTPRFDEDKIKVRKDQLLQDMKQRNDDTATIETIEKGFLAFGENFWANRHTTAASTRAITRADLQSFHRRWFVPQNFVVAVSGDFDRATMTTKLEKLFMRPDLGKPAPPAIMPTNLVFAGPGVYLVNKPDVNQAAYR